jgi:hypothetical protein
MLGSDPKAPPGGKRPRHEDAADVALEAACAIPSDPETASVVLMQSYEAQAPAEALLRAFLAEREGDPARVRVWLAVHARVVEQCGEER